MRNTYRPSGRFFCLLVMAAPFLGVPSGLLAAAPAGPAMTQIIDTVYRADGIAAKGTVLISWPAFTTADGYAVAAGSLSVPLGNGGAFSANLAPNTGAQPAGVYYKVVYQLSGQEPSTEYWVVPATGSVAIGSVRAKLMPPTIGAQVLTRDVADTNYLHLNGNSSVNGVVTFQSPPSVPTPQNPGDAASKEYVDTTEGNLLASPTAIGGGAPNAATFTTINKVINPTAYSGSTIDAQINSAATANNCGYGNPACVFQLPPESTFTFSSTLTIPFGVILDCGWQTSDFIHGVLNYTGSGTAISIPGSTSSLRNCSIVAPRASTVLDVSGQAARVSNIYFVGASSNFSSSTTLIRNHGNKNSYDNIYAEGFSGIGFVCDHAIDTFLNTFDFYGLDGNTTGISLLIERGCDGIHVDHFSGGSSGLHALVVRNTTTYGSTGGFPAQFFFNDFIGDCSYSDAWYFDPSLYNSELDAHFVNSWAAGAGINCTNSTTVQAHKAGIRISGGSAIHITNSMIRANSGSGVMIDSSTGYNSSGIVIGDNQILSNNRNNDGTESGIDVTQVVAGLSLHDNTITNLLEGSGSQKYGINIASNSTDVNIYGNDIFGNVTASTNYAAGVSFDPLVAGNTTVQNLTVNGTCTGCGTGNSGNLASPPAIGNVTPNAGTFTVLNAQSVNGTLNAAAFPGADACAQINNAIAALPTTGGIVDATGFTAAQLGGGCSTTVNAGVTAMTLRFGAGTWKLGGNPGINVTAPKVTIECPKASEGDSFNTVQATLMSRGPYPLIADTVQSVHGTDGLIVRNCYLDGNSTGTFGLFLPYGSSGHLENVYTRNFTSAGQFISGGQWTMWAAGSGGNGGDGLVLGYDSSVDGNPQFAGNSGSAIHIISGGNVLHGVGTYKNRLHGIYVDGRAVGDWTASTTYVQQSFVRPVAGNAGNFVYYTQTPGTTGGARPGFCQVPGCTFSDGSVTWINTGTGYGYTAASIFENAWWNFLESANSTSNGFQAPSGFDADDIRIEGTVTHPAFQNNVSAAMVRQSEGNDSPAHGLHLINTNYAAVNNVQWVGAGYSNNADLGGLRFEASKGNTVSNVNCWFSYSNCIQLVSANNSTFTGLNAVNNGLAGTPQAGTYAVTIDGGSVANTINDLNVRDDRGPAYSRGVSDAGVQTIIGNYRKSNLAANPDSYGAGFVQEFSTASAPTYNAGSGQGFVWKSGGAQTGQLDAVGNWSVAGTLSAQAIPGHEYFVSKYASIQAAIDAAYNNGTVQGGATVIDDRLAPYSGAGFIVRDSVTLKLAATTYTITGTVSNNNGIANVTAGIISMPGSHIVGASTSPNHGTNVNAGNGLNADLIATSTIGTGSGANAQWWHWGSIENFHVDGNKANQTAGNCINVENMGETAVLRALELGNCYASDIKLEGNFATQSEISNVTVNSAGQFGVNLNNFEGVGVLRGLSGDSNATSIIRFNGSQSATLTVLGLKSEEEISGHDPLITIDMPADGSQPAFSLVGGYTYARPGVHDVIKVINGKAGVAPFVTVSNFYVDANFVNAVNDTVNSRTFGAANMNKVPFSYLPTGSYQSGQAFTFAPGTFIQGGNSALTEIFGSSTDGSSMIASQGNGDGTSYYTGGLKIGIPNRTQFGQPPEMMARMGSRFLGVGQGYDANTWVFVPIWRTGDSSNRWIGDPNQRWPEVYASDVNATTATVGTLNVTSCVGCGGSAPHSFPGSILGPTAAMAGSGSMTALYSVTIPAGTFSVGTGLRCTARSRHTTGSGSVSMGWRLGSTTYTYPTPYTTGTTGGDASIEIFTFSSLGAETVNIPWAAFGGTTESPYTGLAWSESVSGAATLQFMFSAASGDKLTGDGFYCATVQ
jgi:hypothetical protein